MNHPVLSALLPVIAMIALGWAVGRRGWIGKPAIQRISNLVFLLLTPALLFRTMSRIQPQQLDFTPVLAYFIGVGLVFAGTLFFAGFSRRSAVLALAGTFSNAVMIGIPMVGLAYGEAGLVVLFTLYTMHTVLLLTSATVILELAVAREAEAGSALASRSMGRSVLTAVKNALLHPVPLPILAGMLFAQTGLAIPEVIDTPLRWLGVAFGPLALLLVGLTLASTPVGQHARAAISLSAVKNLAHPMLVAAAAWLLGLRGLQFAVIVVTASLPIGANVYLFSQRYGVSEELVTAAVALSAVVALMTVPLVMWLVGFA